ncbi:MAG: hypothetical protein GY786_11725 [Proteobacteria bacterium]|nr:hypothetical protein [Pseudomonadota bacterium]
MSNSTPFIYEELRNTVWYQRFLNAEYEIRLDKYPTSWSIKDKLLNRKIPSEDLRIASYKHQIINFFTKCESSFSQMNSLRILLYLRKIRERVFPEVVFFDQEREISVELSAGVVDSPLDEISSCLDPALTTAFKQSCEILFIPGEKECWQFDLLNWIVPRAKNKKLICATFDDVLSGSVTRIDDRLKIWLNNSTDIGIDEEVMFSLPFTQSDLSYLRDFVDRKGLIFTTNIWVYFELFQKVVPLSFSLDNREWTSRGIFQKAFTGFQEDNGKLHSSHYKNLISKEVFDSHELANDHHSISGYQKKLYPNNISLTGLQYNGLSLADFLKGENVKPFQNEREQQLKFLKEMGRSLEITPIIRSEKNNNDLDIEVSGIIVDEAVANVDPIFMDELRSADQIRGNSDRFLSEFNYYYTPNLVDTYNREVSEQEKLVYCNFLIDYIGTFDKELCYESIPLYNKAFLGLTKEGHSFAGYYEIEEIILSSGNDDLTFSKSQINPQTIEREFAIYLPSFLKLMVGEERECLVVVQDQVIYQGPGPCRIPPIGVVITSRKRVPLIKNNLRWSISFQGMSTQFKKSLKWMVGGFNLLVYKGHNLYQTDHIAQQSLEKEGWFSLQSQLTQETQLLPNVRQPRAVFGKTNHNRLVLISFSGRTDLSAGVTFSESIAFTGKYLEPGEELDFLINLDGGASVGVSAIFQDRFQLLGLPAASDRNPVGVGRPLSSYLSITIKNR